MNRIVWPTTVIVLAIGFAITVYATTSPAAPTTTIGVIYAPISGLPAPAVRLTPPTPPAPATGHTTTTTALVVAPTAGEIGSTLPERCTQYEPLLVQYAPAAGWDIARMSYFSWRESRCDPTVRSTSADSGLWQINDVNLPYLRSALGEPVDRWTLLDPVQNTRAASVLCTYWRHAGASCYAPWN